MKGKISKTAVDILVTKIRRADAGEQLCRIACVFLGLMIGLLAGLVLTAVIPMAADQKIVWILIFTGYSAVIAWFAATFMEWRHSRPTGSN